MSPQNNPVTGADVQKLMDVLTGFKGQYETLDADFKKFGAAQSETVVKLGKLTDDMITLQTKYADDTQKRLDAIEGKMNRTPAEPQRPKSIGEQVIADEKLVAFLKSGSQGSAVVAVKGPLFEQKDILNVSRTWAEQMNVIAAGPRLPIGVRSLIPQGRTTAGAVVYVEETSFTNNAAPVAEGAAKPKSDKVFTPRTLPVETIAHYFKISRQTADDLPFLVAQVENNGIYGVQKVEDNQLLNGTGVSPQLKGIMPLATAAPAPGTGANLVDAIGAAIFDLAAKGYVPDGAVTNPADWGKVALLKNTQGNYIFANPMDYATGGRIWGVRLVQSANMAAGAFLAGAFQGNSQILDREDVNVQIANQNEDDFIKNMLTVRVEERLVLIVYQPAAFEKGVVPAGTTMEI
jgi:HK97 family phage major capsid protein